MAIASKMDDREIRNRLDFLGSTESDTEPPRSLKSSAGKPIPEFLKEFYDDLFRHPAPPIIPPNGATQDGLGRAQAGYARPHLDGCPGTGYVNRQGAIGPPHARIKIFPK